MEAEPVTTDALEAQPGVEPPDAYATLWAQVNETDHFETWEKLIAEAIKVDDIEKVRKVLDAFLARYPLCYGYWQKYCNAEVKHGDATTAEAVLQRGVASTPYSIELWIHYINWKRGQPECEPAKVRELFERAAQYVASDYNSHKLWDKWVEYESSQEDIRALLRVYCSVLALPIKELPRYQQSFTELASTHDIRAMVSEEDLALYTAQAKREKAERSVKAESPEAATEAQPDAAAAEAAAEKPGEAEEEEQPPGVEEAEQAPAANGAAAEAAAEEVEVDDAEVKACWLGARLKMCEAAGEERARREPFEKGIRRFWWHYKPLDAAQLLNWWRFLDYVEASGDGTALYALFERCLVACASYPEYWKRYVFFLQTSGQLDIAATAVQRACNVFCSKNPDMLLFGAAFYEATGNAAEARALLQRLQTDVAPRSLEVVVRHANFERRHGDVPAAIALYDALLSEEKSHADVDVCTHLALQYASFLHDVGKHGDAQGVLDGVLEQFPASVSLWRGAIALAERLPGGEEQSAAVMALYTRALTQRVKAPKGEPGTAEGGAAGGTSAEAEKREGPLALALADREVLAGNAVAYADASDSVSALWESQKLLQALQLEFLENAQDVKKRGAANGYAGEPAAKRQATEASAADAAAWAALTPEQQAAYYQQQPTGGYDYSGYYQQQQPYPYYPTTGYY